MSKHYWCVYESEEVGIQMNHWGVYFILVCCLISLLTTFWNFNWTDWLETLGIGGESGRERNTWTSVIISVWIRVCLKILVQQVFRLRLRLLRRHFQRTIKSCLVSPLFIFSVIMFFIFVFSFQLYDCSLVCFGVLSTSST